MKQIIYFLISISFCIPAIAQTGPANTSDCILWLKADAGTRNGGSEVTSSGILDEWQDQSGSGNHTTSATTSPFKVQDNTSAERRINYNPVVLFDQTSDQFIGVDLGMDNATSISEFYVFQSAPSPDPANNYRGVFAWSYSVSLGFNGAHRLENDPFTDSYVIFDDFMPDNLNSAGSDDSYYSQSIKGGIYDGTTFIGYSNGGQATSLTTSDGITTDGNPYRIGDVEGSGTNNPFSIGEIILYSTDLSANKRRQVDTYLALKYGITLSHAYRSTTNTNIYPVATYGNHIIGLGRQDNSGLYQKQSHSIDDSIRIYLGTLQTTNTGNTGTFAANNSFVVLGDDDGDLYATTSSDSEVPGSLGLNSRLGREWKIVKTNITEDINIDITLNTEALPHIVDINDLRFVVDDDGDFSGGTTSAYFNGDGTGITISYSNPVITISGISTTHLANNSTNYFTIGSADPDTPLPVELVAFTATLTPNQKVRLHWTTAMTKNHDYFTIEKSLDGKRWKTVNEVHGNTNTSTTKHYFSYDHHPYRGTSYYRLKQTDLNGTFSYSSVTSIQNTPESSEVIYPNPTTHSITIFGKDIGKDQVYIVSPLGQSFNSLIHIVKKEEDKLTLDVSALKAGLYLVKTTTMTKLLYKQ